MIIETIKDNLINYSKKIKFNILKKIFFLSSISYFIYYLILNFKEIPFENQFGKNNIYLSFLCSLLSIILNGLAWKNIIIWLGQDKNIKNLIPFFIMTNSLKYVPGGIWHFVERFNFLKRRTNQIIAFYGILVEPYFMLTAGLLLASTGLFFHLIYGVFIIPLLFLNRNLIYYILIKIESLKNRSINIINIPNSKNQFNSQIKIKSFFPIKALSFEILFVISKFLSFMLCFSIFNSENNINIFFMFVVFCLSWAIGLIVPAAPGGLGVFEACFLLLVDKNYPQNIIIISLIYFRFISTTADLLFSSPFLFKKYISRN